jgi:hydroxyacylglutathione hydrolase
MKAHIEINDKKTYFIQQFYTKCIAEAAYYIESGKSVAICDPLRDVDTYIDLAA